MLSVSIIIPCYNEKMRIRLLLDAIYAQTFPRNLMEVVLADGMSTDGTKEIVSDWSRLHQDLRLKLLENEKQIIPAALNQAIENTSNDVIIRLDAHSHPYPDYVTRTVSALDADVADNVGGLWVIKPGSDTWIARSISLAASHPLGVGDALYRHGKKAAYVETVPFGGFRRELWVKLGGFDETLLTNEDYEFNSRILKSGGKIWFDPDIQSVYYSRSTLSGLARQYWRYGYWKYRMVKRYPDTIRWRQALPPAFVASLLLGLLLVWIPLFRGLLIFEFLLYSITLTVISIKIAVGNREPALVIGVPASIASMHISWGSGFLWSMAKGLIKK
jgi:cellulose synthase/poly-beta-1,6-N-acetylglucosamine synthase-like glycosyltransferase